MCHQHHAWCFCCTVARVAIRGDVCALHGAGVHAASFTWHVDSGAVRGAYVCLPPAICMWPTQLLRAGPSCAGRPAWHCCKHTHMLYSPFHVRPQFSHCVWTHAQWCQRTLSSWEALALSVLHLTVVLGVDWYQCGHDMRAPCTTCEHPAGFWLTAQFWWAVCAMCECACAAGFVQPWLPIWVHAAVEWEVMAIPAAILEAPCSST
jgi:hypothetical protein